MRSRLEYVTHTMHDMNTLTRQARTPGADRTGAPMLPATVSPRSSRAAVEIVLPVYNEQHALGHCVRTLHDHLSRSFGFPFQITIADNASTDATLDVASALAKELHGIEVLYLDRKGRGRALRAAWQRSGAQVLAYMDVDLSTDLSALGELLTPLLEGHGDLAIGSRLAPGAHVTRGRKRDVISRCYNLLLRALLGVTFSDAQCGFKAGRREVLQPLLDEVEDEAWFFDTELLFAAQQRKLAIHEVPVRWVDDPDSRVNIVETAREDLRGVARLRKARAEAVQTRKRTSSRLPGQGEAHTTRQRSPGMTRQPV
jgi:glycosyltransferase involved in cell wall biosynthesis